MEDLTRMRDWTKYYQFLLDRYGFQVWEIRYYPSAFGDQHVYLWGPLFRVRFATDKSVPEIGISLPDKLNEYIGQYLWRTLIHGKRPKWYDDLSVKFETIAAALEDDMPTIERLCSANELVHTRESLARIIDEQFRELYRRNRDI